MKRFITIIPAELQQEANEYCSQFTDGGQYTFQAQLSADGTEPATHFISNWNMTKAEEFIMKQKYESYMTEVEEMSHVDVLKKAGLKEVIKPDALLSLTEE